MGRSEVKREAFPHHTGGVVHVQYRTRYGIVPEALLEDVRLDLSSRGVGAWLAIKPPGWQISVVALLRRLELGKDRWQRIASELEAAGYLVRQKSNGSRGQWVWNIIFNPEPAPVAGFSGDGEPGPGSTADGLATAGEHGHKVLPTEELSSKDTTTTEPASSGEIAQEKRGGGDIYEHLIFEASVSAMQGPLIAVLQKNEVVDRALCQDLIDELAGVLEAGKRGERQAIKLPSAWFQRLTAKALLGDFERLHCRVVQRRRANTPATIPDGAAVPRPSAPSAEGRQRLAEMKTMLRSTRPQGA